MTPLYHDPHFTFRFADDRIIPRFHLEGVEAGRQVKVFKIDPSTGERLGMLATATVGEGGWVDLTDRSSSRRGCVYCGAESGMISKEKPMHVLKKETAPRYIRPEGITSYLLASPRTSSAEHLTTTLAMIQPGGEQRIHSHRPEQVYFILEGNGLMTVGSETQRVGPGDCVFIPSEQARFEKRW